MKEQIEFYRSALDEVECRTCLWGIGELQTIVAAEVTHNIIESIATDICFVARIMPFSACRGFVYGAVTPIADSLAAFLLDPNYSCEHEIKVCSTTYFTKLDPTAYVQRLLDDKPEELKSNDYI